MPKCNHRRGQNAQFVFRREHGHLTHDTCYKTKRASLRYYKKKASQAVRRIPKTEKPRIRRSVIWDAY